jgi:coenzyme F420-0:L-glutamate ligase/coenzyme F420-1:gamma-L-glutamate ligase
VSGARNAREAAPPQPPSISFTAVPGICELHAGQDLALEIRRALAAAGLELRAGDVLVVAQKVVSKAEGRFVDLRGIAPSARALELAQLTGKDARLVEVILQESRAVVRAAPNVLIVRHRLGFVMANAGVDRSNVDSAPGQERVLLLPRDPDAAAAQLRERLLAAGLEALGVIVSDSFGRPWRNGVVNVALGVAGLPALIDRRGELDRHGRTLEMTQVAWADAIAAGAALAMGEAAEGIPVVRVRGLSWRAAARDGRALLRPEQEDLFR